MTLLFTKCPYCGSNLMLLNTEDSKANCIICSKFHDFTESEVKEAEAKRDSVSEKYLPQVQRAFEAKDFEAMKAIADELVHEGISSWYAWMCIGWLDMREGNTGNALEDLKLAASFLDEENYDEFYETAMEVILDAMEEAARNDKEWFTEDASLVTFAATLSERFEHLQSDGDFVMDLLKRVGTLEDDVDKQSMGLALISEIVLCVLDYYSGNTFVIDHQDILNSAISSIETIQSKVESMKFDGSVNRQLVSNLGPGYVSFMKDMLAFEDSMAQSFTEDQLLDLCDYWSSNDYEEVFDLFQDVFTLHNDVVSSGGRNKGAVKKRDAAMAEYEAAYRKPLDEGLTESNKGQDEDFDRICPECGAYLKADDSGMMVCECGFKSRMVTKDILDLPEDMGKLVPMIRRAMDEKDPTMLNNIGEKILSIDEDDWHGSFALAESCLLDSEFGEAVMMFLQASETVGPKDIVQFRKDVVEGIGNAMCVVEDTNQMSAVILMPMLLESLYGEEKGCKSIPELVSILSNAPYDNSFRGYIVSNIIGSLITVHFIHNIDPAEQRALCVSVLELIDRMEASTKTIKEDEPGMKDDVLTFTQSYRDMLNVLIAGYDSKASDPKEAGFITGYWSAAPEEYEELVGELGSALSIDDNVAYSPKSNTMQKAVRDMGKYVDIYVKAGRD